MDLGADCPGGVVFVYLQVITTRSYDERLATIDNVRKAGINVCSGGIIGLGEKAEDRVGLIHEMSQMEEPPESFPVNALVPIPGTPLGENEVRVVVFFFLFSPTQWVILPARRS